MRVWLIYRRKDRLEGTRARQVSGSLEEIQKEMDELQNSRNLELVDVAESIEEGTEEDDDM